MKKIIPHAPTHLRDSQTLIKEINKIGPLPSNAKLFPADATATAMYTNIQHNVGIASIATWMQAYPETVPQDVPQELLITLLNIIMRRNVFSFDDTHRLQEIGTAMGTPCACPYATLSYALHEVQKMLAHFHEFLLMLKRFMNDMFRIWIVNEEEENLRLYIPANSVHPPGCFKGIIFGKIIRYWNQNSNIKDYAELVSKFSHHLQARGHNISEAEAIMLEAASHIDNKQTKKTKQQNEPTSKKEKILFIHWQFHPHDIDRTAIHQIYN
jgi:hypothetical protein